MDVTTTERGWQDAVLAVLGLVLPVACAGCGAADRALCVACRTALDHEPRRVRLVAGVRLDAGFEYGGLVRTVLLELKLRGRVDLARPLGARFGALVLSALAEAPAGTLLLRVPPSPQGARRRGFDPVVLLLARGGVRRPRALRRVRRPRAGARGQDPGPGPGSAPGPAPGPVPRAGHGQKERSAVERVAATVGTLRAVGVADRDVVVVDDVVTTGVTMAEAVRAVRAAGGRVVRCVAVASVDE
ncbi:putative amidophosphoribosyltransferase [Curtobacterium flaccumfaciens]|uniref:Putative amidophosphoribosyltransferase n=1 Tax=Curtobacterium flaccumfaciens TaxID=2035 RepID=A0A4V3BL82_9MICO|nr:putative amidophosphoribosyltransferase [Curtobacterium flaccumfaciens]